MLARGFVCAASVALVFGCAEPAQEMQETQEIIDNLVQAGFPADDIMVVDGVVYVGRDAQVSLAASREMLQTGDSSQEQYRTTNLVSTSLAKICVDGSTYTGVFSAALDLAIQNYAEQPLTFTLARTPSSGCGFTINAVLAPGTSGGQSGFPSGGLPFPSFTIRDGYATASVDRIEYAITHELGHTIGLRHSDYYNRFVSCSQVGGGANEGAAPYGAILVPGTPSTAVVGGSIMNSCAQVVETGEFTPSDITALLALYGRPPNPPNPASKLSHQCMGMNTIRWTAQAGATSYQLSYSSTSSFTDPVVIYSGPGTSSLIDVPQSSTWYLRARACNATGCSGYTNQAAATYWAGPCA